MGLVRMPVSRKPSFKLIRISIGGGGDGELDGGVKRVDVVEEHIQILWGPSPQEEDVVDETFPCVLADGDRAAGQELGFQSAHEEVGG